jgi:hypothetical protein
MDVLESAEEVETALDGLKKDLGASNTELRMRIAQLEHEVAKIKRLG